MTMFGKEVIEILSSELVLEAKEFFVWIQSDVLSLLLMSNLF